MYAHGMLAPVLTLIAWTFVMWLWMYATRIPAMRKANIDVAASISLAWSYVLLRIVHSLIHPFSDRRTEGRSMARPSGAWLSLGRERLYLSPDLLGFRHQLRVLPHIATTHRMHR